MVGEDSTMKYKVVTVQVENDEVELPDNVVPVWIGTVPVPVDELAGFCVKPIIMVTYLEPIE